MQLYDRIGAGYASQRRADPRIADAILVALGDCASVVNVGAGTGSYEPVDRFVIAVEPSRTMIGQRSAGHAPVVQASADRLPFDDASFAAGLAVLTIHHWPDPLRGLRELARVSRDRVVVLTFDPEPPPFWLTDDYFPEIRALDRRSMPSLEAIGGALGPVDVRSVPIPHDCIDGFLGAYWRRPTAYLDHRVRSAMSVFSRCTEVEAGVERLRADLADGTWIRRYGYLSQRPSLDLGYRLVIANALRTKGG